MAPCTKKDDSSYHNYRHPHNLNYEKIYLYCLQFKVSYHSQHIQT